MTKVSKTTKEDGKKDLMEMTYLQAINASSKSIDDERNLLKARRAKNAAEGSINSCLDEIITMKGELVKLLTSDDYSVVKELQLRAKIKNKEEDMKELKEFTEKKFADLS